MTSRDQSPVERIRTALADRYRIERELGRGGMAVVYLARDLRHDRPVALKVVLPEVAADFGPERFLREIRLTARLDHPNILALLDSGEAAGSLFYVMPYVEGESLRDRLRRDGPLPLEVALRIGSQVARALHHAHQHGVVHRDIKPENILLTGDDARVADFGVARATAATADGALTRTGLAIGTPVYMSPEQATGARDVDARTDIYSLGCVIYEMLAGEPPYTGATPQVVLARKLQEPLPSLRVARATVPPTVELAVRRALATLPADRHATAQLLAEALEGTTPPGRQPASGRLRRGVRPGRTVLVGGLVALLAGLGGWWFQVGRAPSGFDSLAVLPLENLTGDSTQAYFVDGMHEALTTELSQLSAVKVISRTSAIRYRGGGTPAPQIGRELGVKGLIEGSVAREGNQVRITVQLIDAASDRRLWGGQFTRELRSVLALHTEVARAIAEEIRVTITPQERVRLSAARPVNPEAFELYLLGRHQWNRRTVELTHDAIGRFRGALRLDSAYAPAHAALADAYLWLGEQGALRQEEGCALAAAAIRAALALDESLAEAHVAMAQWQMGCNWNWPEAERAYRRAQELSPGSAVVHQYYGRALSRVTPRLEEGLQELLRAKELDPLSTTIRAYLGQRLLFAGQLEQAEASFREALSLTPDHVLLLHSAGEVALARGRWEEAIGYLERSLQQPGQQSSHYLAVMGAAYARGNRRAAALTIQAELGRRADAGLVSASDMAHLSLALGDPDQALTWLERGYERRDSWLAELLAWPWLDPLASTPRYQAIVEKMQLPW